jgi:hypothetical protein
VLCISDSVPGLTGINILNTISPPAATGLVTAGPAAPLLAGWCQFDGAATVAFGTTMVAGACYSYAGRVVSSSTTLFSNVNLWSLTPGTHFPRGAKSIICRISAVATGGTPNATINYHDLTYVLKPGGTYPTDLQFNSVSDGYHALLLDGSGNGTMKFNVEIPIPRNQQAVGLASNNLDFAVAWAQSVGVGGVGTCQITGFRL